MIPNDPIFVALVLAGIMFGFWSLALWREQKEEDECDRKRKEAEEKETRK